MGKIYLWKKGNSVKAEHRLEYQIAPVKHQLESFIEKYTICNSQLCSHMKILVSVQISYIENYDRRMDTRTIKVLYPQHNFISQAHILVPDTTKSIKYP